MSPEGLYPMKLRNGDPTNIECDENETVTITIVEKNTRRLVSKKLNGVDLIPDQFNAGPKGTTSNLAIGLGFSGGQLAGSYLVTLSGNGPDTSVVPVVEPPPPKMRSVPYSVRVP